MPTAAWCSECQAYVWVGPHGGCLYGHPYSSLSWFYEVVPQPAEQPMSADTMQPQGRQPVASPSSIGAVVAAQRLAISAIALDIASVLFIGGACLFVPIDQDLVSGAVRMGLGSLIVSFALVSVLAGLIGVWRLASALGYSADQRTLCFAVSLIGIARFVVLLVLIDRATKVLRTAGLEVGLWGARVETASIRQAYRADGARVV